MLDATNFSDETICAAEVFGKAVCAAEPGAERFHFVWELYYFTEY